MRKLKTIQELTFADDYLFCKVLTLYPDAAKDIIKAVTDREVEKISLSKQYAVDPFADAKSVRFDVYLKGESEVYDIEMQTTKKKDIVKRSRYYLGINDVEFLGKGDDYSKLPNSFIIFICTFDPFDKGYLKYVCQERLFGVEENAVDISEQANFSTEYQKVFVNAEKVVYSHVNMTLVNLINYICKQQVSDELTAKLDKYVNEVKKSKEEARDFMTFQEKLNDMYVEAKAEGLAEGRAEGLIQGKKEEALLIAKTLLEQGVSEEIVLKSSTQLSKEEIQKIKKDLETKH